MGRTKKNIKLKIPEKPRKIKGFRSGGYRIATTISSQPRYDHFDTSPIRPLHYISNPAKNQALLFAAVRFLRQRILLM